MRRVARRLIPKLATGVKPDPHKVRAYNLDRLLFLMGVAQDLKIGGDNWLFELAYRACVDRYGSRNKRGGKKPPFSDREMHRVIEVFKKMRKKGYSPRSIARAFVYVEPFYSEIRRRLANPETRNTAISGAPDRIRKRLKKLGAR